MREGTTFSNPERHRVVARAIPVPRSSEGALRALPHPSLPQVASTVSTRQEGQP